MITIGNRKVGPGEPVCIVAELSANHGQSIDKAVQLVREAAEAGADAIKLQTFTPDTIAAPGHIIQSGLWKGRELRDLYAEAMTPWNWHEPLFRLAGELGMLAWSTPFSIEAVDFLAGLDVPAFKIASFELVDLALIRHVASKGKPVILSTGMGTKDDIWEALSICWKDGVERIQLKCISAYPAPIGDANLRTITAMIGEPGWLPPQLVGLSDHTQSNAVVSAAVTLGACMVERHLKLGANDTSLDAAFSDTPEQFAAMVKAVRDTEAALGTVHYGPTESERESVKLRRSLWVVQDVRKGERFTAENVRSLRPADGLAPKHWDDVLGKRAARDCRAGEAMTFELLE